MLSTTGRKAENSFASSGFDPLARDSFGGRDADPPFTLPRIFDLLRRHRVIEFVAFIGDRVPCFAVVTRDVHVVASRSFFLASEVRSRIRQNSEGWLNSCTVHPVVAELVKSFDDPQFRKS